MHSKRSKLLNVLVVGFLFALFNFITSGFGACMLQFFEYHGKPDEMFGWSGLFLLMGSTSLVLCSGGLLALSVYVFISDAVRSWSYIFSVAQGILLGILFLLSTYFLIEVDSNGALPVRLILYIQTVEWLFFAGVSAFSCIFFNRKYSETHFMEN